MTEEIRSTDDDMLEVRVCEDGICRTGFVSSMHLVATKVHQLKQAIQKESAAAFLEPIHDA
jgi:hypothetical protein